MNCTPEDAVAHIHSGDTVFIHTAAATPHALVNALVARSAELKDVTLYHLHTEGSAPYAQKKYYDSFIINAFFIGRNVRKCIQESRSSYIPVFLSEIPALFRRGIIKLDHALVSVSPPDQRGFCSLGSSVDVSKAAMECANHVVAQVNSRVPRAHGDGMIKMNHFDKLVYVDKELPEIQAKPIDDAEKKIGKHIAELIDDGATLQMGIGAIPDAVLSCLGNHKNLGVHTEMFSDGLLPLIESGVVTGSLKKKHVGVVVSSFVTGTRKLYDFIDDNPGVRLLESSYVNDGGVIRKNPNVTAINSAIEIDLTGQVCADSVGKNIYSGVGGQMDFIRGASLSPDGKPIIAIKSTTKSGNSKIAPFLQEGAGVVTTRAHVHYVVTEYGVVNLYGMNLKERAHALISIAHPKHRETLERKAFELYK